MITVEKRWNDVSVSVISPDNQTDFLNGIAAKVPLLAVDNDADKSNRRCYLGTDNIKAGHAVGKLIKEAMPKGGTIFIYALTILLLLWRPQGLFGRKAT